MVYALHHFGMSDTKEKKVPPTVARSHIFFFGGRGGGGGWGEVRNDT